MTYTNAGTYVQWVIGSDGPIYYAHMQDARDSCYRSISIRPNFKLMPNVSWDKTTGMIHTEIAKFGLLPE